MTDDDALARALLRLREADPARAGRLGSGPEPIARCPAFVGRVVANPAVPTSTGRYFSVRPVTALGLEGEGETGTLAVAPSTTVLVYVVGAKAPAAGDDLVCRHLGHRWVAERASGQGGRIVIDTPFCPCPKTPRTLRMTATPEMCGQGVFRSATLVGGPLPDGFAGRVQGINPMLSAETFTDLFSGDRFRYVFTCESRSYALSRIYPSSPYGDYFQDLVRYRWPCPSALNGCNPFLLLEGVAASGGDSPCKVSVTE